VIPIQASKAGEYQGVSFQFNEMAIKFGREFNARRNTRFMGRDNTIEQIFIKAKN
jgi:hypothetical protein